jgi:hypothetical protein
MKSGDESKRQGLRLIRGGRDRERPGDDPPLVVVGREESPPFPVDALVLEDDTYFVLSASPELREPSEASLQVWNELHETEPVTPGEAVIRSGTPPRISAVVHDLSLEPTWDERWVVLSLAASLRLAEERGFRSLGLQPLGCVHGRLAPERFPRLLRGALDVTELQSVRRVWLIGDPELFDLTSMGDDEDSK